MESTITDFVNIAPRVAEALLRGDPVVALESTVIAHGLPDPVNLQTATAMETAIRDAGAEPATIGLIDGRVVIGLEPDQMRALATAADVVKVSRRNIASTVASGRLGATTVAATMIAATRAGIRIFATGGIGGVHRGVADSHDVSADLTELSRSPVAVVCAGAKSILDLPRTLEVLETAGVPIVGYGTDAFPAFHAVDSGLSVDQRADTPAEAAAILHAHWALGLGGGVVFANPCPADAAIPLDLVEAWVAEALAVAREQAITGHAVTPFLLAELGRRSDGRTLQANVALLRANAAVAADIALAYANRRP